MSLPRPGPVAAVTEWTPHPLMIAVSLVLAVGYGAGMRRLHRSGVRWPVGRAITFGVGVVVLAWTGCGFLASYASSIYWAWTARVLVLWLVVPIVLLSGRPVQLARAAGRGAPVDRFLRSRPARVIAKPLVGPALVPALSAVLFFGPVAGWSIGVPPFGWVLDVVLLVVGALMVLPLVGLDGEASSLAVGLSLAIGSFELVLDALPGVVLRLNTTTTTWWFAHRDLQAWSPAPLRDQQVAGAILWCAAELIDLPFLVLVFRRWLRADARDAAQVDAVLEAERAARRAMGGPSATSHDDAATDRATPAVERDAPWWESDPVMQERLRRPR